MEIQSNPQRASPGGPMSADPGAPGTGGGASSRLGNDRSGELRHGSDVLRKPGWLKVPLPGGEAHGRLKTLVRELGLHTVCEEARCPNIGECWKGEHATMTLMVLGDECTRACRFCAVKTVKQAAPPDPAEPAHVGQAIAALGLSY